MITTTPIPMPFHMVVRVYNEAGEVVRNLYDGSISHSPASFGASEQTMVIGEQTVSLNFSGLLENGSTALIWAGDNDQTQEVTSGTYYFKIEVVDFVGKVTAYIQPVSVLEPRSPSIIRIYNTAGEIVYEAYNTLAQDIVDFYPATPNFAPNYDPATGQALNLLNVTYRLEDGSLYTPSVGWDGRNSRGQPVDSGVYSIQLVREVAGSNASEITIRKVTVLQSNTKLVSSEVIPAQNPVVPGADGSVNLDLRYPVPPRGTAFASVYNIAGELVAQGYDLGGYGQLKVPMENVSAGVYVVEFSIREGSAILMRTIIKVAVVR
jgi:hypothetical protein